MAEKERRGQLGREAQSQRVFTRRRFVQGSAAGALSLTLLSAWPAVRNAQGTELSVSTVVTGFSGDFASIPAGPDLQALVDLASSIKARTIRFPLDWARVQPEPGVYDWSAYDDLHRELVWSGLQGIPVLFGAPEWLKPDELRSTPGGLHYPQGHASLNAFGDFAVEAVLHFTRYASALKAIEVWARPNAGATLIDDPQAFACLVDSVALATSALLVPGEQIPEPIEILAGALATQSAEDWRPYAEAVAAGPIAVQQSLDYAAGGDPSQLSETIGGDTKAATGQTDRKSWINVAAPPVGGRGTSDWQTLRELAACEGLPDCRGITINPLHPLLNTPGGAGSCAGYPEGAPLIGEDWRPTNAYEAVEDAWVEGAGDG